MRTILSPALWPPKLNSWAPPGCAAVSIRSRPATPALSCPLNRVIRVHGEVYRLRDPPALLETLDRYEGCGLHSPKPFEYERVRASARLNRGRSIEVWTYIYRRPVRDEDLVISGRYELRSPV